MTYERRPSNRYSFLTMEGEERIAAVINSDSTDINELAKIAGFDSAEYFFGSSDFRNYQIVLEGHAYSVQGASFSPDSQLVQTFSFDNDVRVWDANSGSPVAVLSGHTEAIRSAQFSSDGKLLLTASSDGTARLWRVADWVCLRIFENHHLDLKKAQFSVSGELIFGVSTDHITNVWRTEGGDSIDSYFGELIELSRGSNFGVFKASGGSYFLQSIDGSDKHQLLETYESLLFLKFSSDGNTIASISSSNVVQLWSLQTGRLIAALPIEGMVAKQLALHPRGTSAVVGCDNGLCRVLHMPKPIEGPILSGHTSEVLSITYSSDGSIILSASTDGTARLFRSSDGAPGPVLEGHEGPLNSAAFSPDGSRIVTASDDGTARIWDVASLV